MWPWSKRKAQFLEPHLEDWQIETWRYLLQNLASADDVASRPPLTPSHPMLTRPLGDDHGDAIILFEQIKEYMGLTDCSSELVKRTERGGKVDTYLHIQNNAPLGTFEQVGNRSYITYAPDLVRNTSRFAAVIGHELAHWALLTIPTPPPGAEHEPLIEELATDLATCFLGLGILHANTAFHFSQQQGFDGQGWASQFSGYLSEEGRVFSLALHLVLRGERDAPELAPHLHAKLAKAMARLDAEPALIAGLRA